MHMLLWQSRPLSQYTCMQQTQCTCDAQYMCGDQWERSTKHTLDASNMFHHVSIQTVAGKHQGSIDDCLMRANEVPSGHYNAPPPLPGSQ